jgi:copper chaperone CopZ
MNPAAQNEKQLIKLDPRVSSGTFILVSPGGRTTSAIAITSTAQDVQAALEAVYGPGNVSVSGAPKAWLVEFTGALGNAPQPLVMADGTNLTGSIVTIFVSHATPGSDGSTPAPVVEAPAPVVEVPAPLPAFVSGSGTVDVTTKPLGDKAIPKSLVIRANGSNSGIICIGNSHEDAGEGYILGKGETTPPICVDNLNKVFLVGSAIGQGYSWLAT